MKIHNDNKGGIGNILSCVTFGDKVVPSLWGTRFSLKTSWSICLPDRTAKKDKNHCSVYQFELWLPCARNTSFFYPLFLGWISLILRSLFSFHLPTPQFKYFPVIIPNYTLYFPFYAISNYIKMILIICLISISPINSKCHEARWHVLHCHLCIPKVKHRGWQIIQAIGQIWPFDCFCVTQELRICFTV